MSRLAEIYKQEIKSGGGITSAVGKRLGEKLDPRQMFDKAGIIATMFPSLKAYSATKPAVTEKTPSPTQSFSLDSGSLTDISAATKMTAKNTLVLPAMARDMNLLRQNIAKVVKLQGGTAATKADMFFKRAGERESMFESAFSKLRGKSGGAGITTGVSKNRDGQTKQTALYVENITGLTDSLLGSLGATAAGKAGGKISGVLAKALPFLASATLPILGIAGLAGLLYFLIRKDSGEAQTADEMEKGGGYTPEQRAVAAPSAEPATDEELKKVRENMRQSEDPAVRAAAAELDRKDAIKALPDESEAERRRLGLSTFTPTPTPEPPQAEVTPSNVVRSESGAAIMTGSGGYVVSGEPSASPTPFPTVTTQTPAPSTTTSPQRTAPTTSGGEVSENLVSFLKQKENPKLAKEKGKSKAWWDYKQYSIGYGTKASGPDEEITEAEADRRLREELGKSQKAVIDYGKKKGYNWNQGQVEALSSFVYNLGPGALNQLTANGTRTNQEISQKLPEYNKAGGKVEGGLVKRRGMELALFNQTPSTSIAPSTPTTGATVASASTSVAEGQRAAMTSAGSTTIVDNSTKTTMASSQPAGKPASAYDRDIVEALVTSSYA